MVLLARDRPSTMLDDVRTRMPAGMDRPSSGAVVDAERFHDHLSRGDFYHTHRTVEDISDPFDAKNPTRKIPDTQTFLENPRPATFSDWSSFVGNRRPFRARRT
jgi:hypothetical protein